MHLSPKVQGWLSLLFFVAVMACIGGAIFVFCQTPFVSVVNARIAALPPVARALVSFIEIPLLVAVLLGVGWIWIHLSWSSSTEDRGTTQTLRFEPSVLPVRALPPFKAQVATVKPSKIWFLVLLTLVNISLNFPFRLQGSSPITGVLEIWALADACLSSRISPLQLSADCIRIGWRRALNWTQVVRAEIWKSPTGRSYRVRFFDADNRKIGQVARLNASNEWPVVLDYLHARAGS